MYTYIATAESDVTKLDTVKLLHKFGREWHVCRLTNEGERRERGEDRREGGVVYVTGPTCIGLS